jgi:YD repeat-containing protein
VSYVANLQTLSDADTDNCLGTSCYEQMLRTDLNTLRTSFTQGMVTTYTYDPLFGATSITDPKGNTTYYEYDEQGRLKFVKDKDLNVLQKYCYNYKGQLVNCADNTSTSIVLYKSIARSSTFTRNNCAGLVGSSLTYNQAAGVVTSVVSQADADALGLAKFNTDGQANANANGTCTSPPVYTFDYMFSGGSSMTIKTYCSVANHPAVTFNFIISYTNKTTNKPAFLAKSFVLPANQISATQSFALNGLEGSETVDLDGPVQ